MPATHGSQVLLATAQNVADYVLRELPETVCLVRLRIVKACQLSHRDTSAALILGRIADTLSKVFHGKPAKKGSHYDKAKSERYRGIHISMRSLFNARR